MAYPYNGPSGSEDHYRMQSAPAYGGNRSQFTGAAGQRTSSGNHMVWAVLVLGVATYIVSCAAPAHPGDTGWGVRFSTLAAVAAAVGLHPRQSTHTKLMVALAVSGFLEALRQLIICDHDPSWVVIVIVVVNALQALTAIAALLSRPTAPNAADSVVAPYDAYTYYAQVAQQYYAATDQQLQQQPVQAQGTASVEVAAPAQTERSAAEQSALYSEYLRAQQSGPNPAVSSSHSGGRTHTAQPAAGAGLPTGGPAEGIRRGYDHAAGPASQSPTS